MVSIRELWLKQKTPVRELKTLSYYSKILAGDGNEKVDSKLKQQTIAYILDLENTLRRLYPSFNKKLGAAFLERMGMLNWSAGIAIATILIRDFMRTQSGGAPVDYLQHLLNSG